VGSNLWPVAPVGPDAQRWVTKSDYRSVLVAVHTLVAGQRLMDVVGLIESDSRVQLVYSKAPAAHSGGVGDFLRSIDAFEIPWEQATYERFDLALATAYTDIDRVHAPVVVMAHGAGRGKRAGGDGPVHGLDAGRLLRDGRPVPDVLVLAHESERTVLAQQCPQALDVTLVAGDPCLDRMVVSLPLRDEYRAELGVRDDRELVVLASTWGTHSLFARFERYLPSFLRQLDPRRYKVAMLLHPAAWSAHGGRQLRAWLTDARAAGLVVLDPHIDWRPVVIAADYVIGDHGSTTAYAAALGRPVLCTDLPTDALNPRSLQGLLGIDAPRLIRTRPVVPQLREAARWQATHPAGALAARLTSRPGQSHQLIRRELYRLLGIAMPGRHRAPEPIPPTSVRAI
jgi:hypothetical protein